MRSFHWLIARFQLRSQVISHRCVGPGGDFPIWKYGDVPKFGVYFRTVLSGFSGPFLDIGQAYGKMTRIFGYVFNLFIIFPDIYGFLT